MNQSRKPRIKWEMVEDGRVRLLWMVPNAGCWTDSANGLPIVLIHGLGCSIEVWRKTLQQFAACDLNRPALAMDMPGYGRSPGPPRTLGINALADWVVRLLDVLGMERVHLASHSLGCQVAFALARRHPERVGGLVLVGPTDGADIIPFWRLTAGLFTDVFFEPLLYNGTLMRMYWEMGPVRFFATVKKMVDDDPVPTLPQIHAPCLILRGANDWIIPEAAARKMADLLPDARYANVPDSAHAVPFNAPAVFAGLALNFWNEIERRASF